MQQKSTKVFVSRFYLKINSKILELEKNKAHIYSINKKL